MIKFVVVFETTVIARAIWRININRRSLPFKLFGKRIRGYQIIVFDNERFSAGVPSKWRLISPTGCLPSAV